MLNLLCMDLYRIFRSKSFYICLGILIIINFLTFGILYLAIHSGTGFLINLGFTVKGNAADIKAALGNLSLLEIFQQGIVGTGSYAVILGILSSLFICVDFESGFIKNIMTAHENKWDYILSKTVSLGSINFLYVAIAYLAVLLLNVFAGGLVRYSPAPDVLFYLLSVWMLMNGFSALTLLISMLTRSKAAGAAAAICINGGMISLLLTKIFSLFNLGWMTDNTIYMRLATFTPFGGTHDFKPFLTGLIYFVIYTILSEFVLSKKDI